MYMYFNVSIHGNLISARIHNRFVISWYKQENRISFYAFAEAYFLLTKGTSDKAFHIFYCIILIDYLLLICILT